MAKITLDRETFKALASDTRLDILKNLDGKHLGLNEIAKATNLNKATLHEHLTKLNEAGLIKRTEREGHKWVYYRLTWKGESLLHPENTRIVVLFTTTFVALWVGIIQLIWYIKGTVMSFGYDVYTSGDEALLLRSGAEGDLLLQNSYDMIDAPCIPEVLQRAYSSVHGGDAVGIPLGKSVAVFEDGYVPAPVTAGDGGHFVVDKSAGVIQAVYQDPTFLYIAIGCFVLFTVVLCVAVWRLWENRTPKM